MKHVSLRCLLFAAATCASATFFSPVANAQPSPQSVEEITPRRPLRPGARVDVQLSTRFEMFRDGSLRHRIVHAVLIIPQVGFRYDLGRHATPGGCNAFGDDPGEFMFRCQSDSATQAGSAHVEGDALIIDLSEEFEGEPPRVRQWRLALPVRARVVFPRGHQSLGVSDANGRS